MKLAADEQLTLAIEATGRGGSLALVRGDGGEGGGGGGGGGGQLLADGPLPMGRRHNVQLALGIEQMLAEQNVKAWDLTRVMVSLGPGSFTGLRVAVTTAKVLCYVNGAQLIGVPTMDTVLAAYGAAASSKADSLADSFTDSFTDAWPQTVSVVMNHKAQTLYAGCFALTMCEQTQTPNWQAIQPRRLVEVQQVIDWGAPVLGPAVSEIQEDLPADLLCLHQNGQAAGKAAGQTPLQAAKQAGQQFPEPTAVDVWRAGLVLLAAEAKRVGAAVGAADISKTDKTPSTAVLDANPATLAPLYVREPEAVTLWRNRKSKSRPGV